MNDHHLNKLLEAYPVPAPKPDLEERLLMRIRRIPHQRKEREENTGPVWNWSMAGLSLGLAIGLAALVGLWIGRHAGSIFADASMLGGRFL